MRSMKRNTIQFSRARSGFTVIEMLATMLIVGVLMALAVSAYQSARDNAQKMDCKANMRAIANMNEQYKYKSATHTYTTTLSDLSTLGPVPVCPGTGTYTATSTGPSQLTINCSVHGDYIQDSKPNTAY